MNANRDFKNAIYDQLGRIGKALACRARLELLDLLCQAPRTVEALAGEADLSTANASRHLQLLRASGLIESRKEGLYVVYRIADPAVGALFRSLRSLAERRLADIERITQHFLEGRGGIEGVDSRELRNRLRRGEVTLIDVRPAQEYRAGHIPGALSIPLKELATRLAELPKDREIVAYCRGPYCVLAVQAVELLRARGYRAMRLRDGVPDWRAAGLKVETGPPGAVV